MKTDSEISKVAKLKSIVDLAKENGIKKSALFLYGDHMAKLIDTGTVPKPTQKGKGKLILVTAINPTKAGEGKTTVSIGLADSLKKIGKKVSLALREPSLGPVFGVKGGACGGGYSQVVPIENINLHFTGDLHAITAANNLIAALIDNHIYWGNELGIEKVTFKRCLDVNDRALRDNFTITAASEMMAILTLSRSVKDLERRLDKIIVGFTAYNSPIYFSSLNSTGALLALLSDAIKPNLVQTLEGTLAFVHLGPFANIAHGCNSIIATAASLALSDYTVTEAGFGADLGAEKFLNIKCRAASYNPDCVVIVATIRALKNLGSGSLKAGLPNLGRHIKNIASEFNLNAVVAINKFYDDTEAEIEEVLDYCKEQNCEAALCDTFLNGSSGGIDLAEKVVELCKTPKKLNFTYDNRASLKEKIETVATKIYGASGVVFSETAKQQLSNFDQDYPICIAKTQYSFSDNPNLLAAPDNFSITVREILLSNGAEFFVVVCGDILRMPGLSKKPNAESVKCVDGSITGVS